MLLEELCSHVSSVILPFLTHGTMELVVGGGGGGSSVILPFLSHGILEWWLVIDVGWDY